MNNYQKRPCSSPPLQRRAFTLAETLITLVIIGVVAALVISPLINTYVENSTVAKVKKGLSILGQAKKLAETQNGPIEGWNFAAGATQQTATQFWSYIKPYISVAKDCGASTDCYQGNGTYYLNGNPMPTEYNTNSAYYKFVLADGSVMWFKTFTQRCSNVNGDVPNVCAAFWYDVNGDKKPNTLGKDIFHYVMSIEGVYPNIDSSCIKTSNGWGCSGYIIKHNNMNYLH